MAEFLHTQDLKISQNHGQHTDNRHFGQLEIPLVLEVMFFQSLKTCSHHIDRQVSTMFEDMHGPSLHGVWNQVYKRFEK